MLNVFTGDGKVMVIILYRSINNVWKIHDFVGQYITCGKYLTYKSIYNVWIIYYMHAQDRVCEFVLNVCPKSHTKWKVEHLYTHC